MRLRIAIQGELGSNSHLAAFTMLGSQTEIVPCSVSREVFGKVVRGEVDAAVLPIENSLHGSVAEHYDLLLEHAVRITRESLLRIRHNLIAPPGIERSEIQRVLSHPVALSQCRRFFETHPSIAPVPFYDTAGSVKHVMAQPEPGSAAIAPELAAEVYGAAVLERGLEDHPDNFTRFHLLERAEEVEPAGAKSDKMTVAFAIEHRPGTLVQALQGLAEAGTDLTRIESRPVTGSPWEYMFYIEARFSEQGVADAALRALRARCRLVKELGRYRAAN